jgi:hypothetical protein
VTQLRRRFLGTTVDTAALRAALEAFNRGCGEDTVGRRVLRLSRRNESWELERVDDFLEEYARGPCQALLQEESGEGVFSFRDDWGNVELTVRSSDLAEVRRVMAPLEQTAMETTFRVFIGHGPNPQWLALANHLREGHGYPVITYESLAEYGQPASQVLDLAARSASVALLVHTSELETVDGYRLAAPNVIHETGFFSAHLGADRALVLREISCRPFANIAGQTELRFSDGNIREVFGDVVAALRRHSGEIAPRGV